MTTGERIKQLRTAKGMSQEDLGKIVGVKKAAIYKYENNIVINLKRSIIDKLAIALETTPTYLLGLDEQPASFHDGLSKEDLNLLKSLSKTDRDIVLSLARQMKQRETESNS